MFKQQVEMEAEQNLEEIERNKLLKIFPEELWKLVLDQILKPQDLESCSRATSFFKTLLEPRKNVFLFPKVLKILDIKRYLDFNHSKGILNCRLVCSLWNTAINNLLEIRPYHSQCVGQIFHFSHLQENQNDLIRNCIFRLYRFTHQVLENQIIPEMRNPLYQTHCPFPSRHIEINEENIFMLHPELDNQQALPLAQYRTQTKNFLQLVGHHFWHAVFHLGDLDQLTAWQWYLLLKSYAQLMPNLKSLYIMCPFNHTNQEQDGIDMEIISFPVLRDLNLLSINMIPGFIVEQILIANQPKILEFGRRHPRVEFPISRITSPEQLCLPLLNAEEFQYLDASWKLKFLKLYILSTENTLLWSTVFERLENFGDTLVDLYLSFERTEESGAIKNIWETSRRPFNLPNLKRLKISTNNVCSLDFLLGLKNLEYLHLVFVNVNIDPDSEDNNRRNLQINYFETGLDAFMESNIWEVMPNLRKVILADGYTSPQRTFIRK